MSGRETFDAFKAERLAKPDVKAGYDAARQRRNAERAVAFAIAPADRKLRYGSKHPENANQPNALAYKVARALLDTLVIEVTEVSDGD